jgi:hypothetical protein
MTDFILNLEIIWSLSNLAQTGNVSEWKSERGVHAASSPKTKAGIDFYAFPVVG